MNIKYLYHSVEATHFLMSPIREFLKFRSGCFNPLLKANATLLERITRKYPKLEFENKLCVLEDKREVKVTQEVVLKKPFCDLLRFNKGIAHPKILVVAPLSGHHATLLKRTVKDLLPYFDVYLTDWYDACKVPISDGFFDLDDYINYCIEFMNFLGENHTVMAVCQPTVPVLAAVSIMSSEKNPNTPKAMVLMGGPIDVRLNPTAVNSFAEDKDMQWFEDNMICIVPPNYPGAGRKVYPGFLQLQGFIAMNWQKHLQSHIELWQNIVSGNSKEVERQTDFYDEYFAVMDMTAEFYLQTVKEVFKDFSLPRGKLISRGRKIDLEAIEKTAILAIEGENDDIAGVGQTSAALKMCSNVASNKKLYFLQKGVGHYGVFSSSKFQKHIVPLIRNFIKDL